MCVAECPGFFHKTLFFMGEIGLNDYSFAVFGMTLQELRTIVPKVVEAISAATEVTVAATMPNLSV